MKLLSRRLYKLFSLISGLSLIFNSILPASILPLLFATPTYAQEATPAATVNPTPTDTIAPTPTDTVAPTPDATPTIIETPTVTLAPTEEATPSPTPEILTPTPTEIAQPTETGPPATPTQEQGQILDGASTVAPTPTPEPTGHIEAAVLKNASALSLDLSSTDISGSAVLTTNKPDYAPTDTVVISGTGFIPDYPYKLFISSTDPPAVDFQTEIKTNSTGDFIYSYQLDGNYRPNYSVTVKKGDTVVATTTFTDSPTKPPVDVTTCAYNCTAQDIDTISFELVKSDGTPLSCTYGTPTNAFIKVNYNNHSSGRYAAYLMGEIWEGGTKVKDIDSKKSCLDTMTNGTNSYVFDPEFSWTCGDSLEIKNLKISWATSSTTCSEFFAQDKCNPPAQSFCSGSVGYIVITPLVPNFTATTACLGDATSFTSTTTGGKEPYTNYSWNFGDSNTGSGQTTTHLYSSIGSYNVGLTVTDSKPQTETTTKSVSVIQCATCGDGQVNQTSEQCDAGTQNGVTCTPNYGSSCNYCSASCQNVTVNGPYCGDGIKNGTEQCDGTDGVTAHYTCTQSCTLEYVPYCGDGQVNQTNEQCDDGNTDNTDACSNSCTFNPSSISGYKYSDADGNISTTGDRTPVSGWGVTLYKCVGSWTPENCTEVVGTTTTDVNGHYAFNNLYDQMYRVTEESRTGWNFLSPSSGIMDVNLAHGFDASVNFVNFQLGKITACKYTDYTGDGTYQSQDDLPLANISIKLSQSGNLLDTKPTGQNGCVTFDGLTAGTYRVEEDYSDPDLNGYYSTNGITHYDVAVASGTDETKIFLNALYRTISGTKYNDLNGNGVRDAGEPGLPGWTIQLNTGATATTDASGNYTFTGLAADSYTISEVQQTGWSQTQPASSHYDVDVHATVTSTGNDFGNHRDTGTVIVHKIIDADGNLRTTNDQTNGGNWEFTVAGNGGDTNGSSTQSTGTNGLATFNDLKTGHYNVGETPQGGFELLSASCGVENGSRDGNTIYNMNVNTDEPTECTFINHPINPILTITKSNNTGGADKSPGDSVEFTITVHADINGGPAYHTQVTDLPAGGFSYHPGSGIISKDNGVTFAPATFIHDYASPGVWDLGTMNPGDTFVLKYTADISGDQQAGLYKDLAYAFADGPVYANDPDHFVGTDVTVVRTVQNGLSHNVVTTVESQVLGASTELPNTGASTFWLYVALALITGGLTLGALGWFLRRKYA